MTHSLQQAVSYAQSLPEDQQDFIAAVIMEELADEERWQEKFARSQAQLSKLTAKARADIQAGRVRQVGVDEL